MTPDPIHTATVLRLRAAADAVSRMVADHHWRLQAAYAMDCLTIDVGIGPVGHNRDSDPVEASNFRVILADLHHVDSRVTAQRFDHDTVEWVEEIAVPLDNPTLIQRVAHWTYHLTFHRVADPDDLGALLAENDSG